MTKTSISVKLRGIATASEDFDYKKELEKRHFIDLTEEKLENLKDEYLK